MNENETTETTPAAELEASALNNLVSHDLFLNGDLCQMAEQRDFLSRRGFALGQQNVYPVVMKSDVIRALSLIWKEKAKGWWHYRTEYIKYGICTEDEFKAGF